MEKIARAKNLYEIWEYKKRKYKYFKIKKDCFIYYQQVEVPTMEVLSDKCNSFFDIANGKFKGSIPNFGVSVTQE